MVFRRLQQTKPNYIIKQSRTEIATVIRVAENESSDTVEARGAGLAVDTERGIKVGWSLRYDDERGAQTFWHNLPVR